MSDFIASTNALRGRLVDADYQPTRVPHHAGNPLIEALPALLDARGAARGLAFFPPYQSTDRQLDGHERLHCIECSQQFFAPLGCHLDLEQRFARMIRGGYLGRNPVLADHWPKLNRRVAGMLEEPVVSPPAQFRALANGFTLLGIPGIGKTTGVERVLQLTPQYIRHRKYQGALRTFQQLVWLKLSCPFNGSVRGLCDTFFQAVDDVCGTRYFQKYGGKGRTTIEMLPHMARVAALLNLGVLVIDEIQNLRGAKIPGRRKKRPAGVAPQDESVEPAHEMLKFFVQLVNTIGLPVVLIGTYAAQPVLSGELHQIRRGCGQGSMEWDRMANDDTWRLFLKSLWHYQYSRQVVPLTAELADALYFETQGITDFAVKIYLLTQMRAINTRTEQVTQALIHSVGQDALKLAAPVLNALRNNDYLALRRLPDLRPINLEEYLREGRLRLDSGRRTDANALPTAADATPMSADTPAAPPVEAALASKPTPTPKRARPTDAEISLGGCARDTSEYLLPRPPAA